MYQFRFYCQSLCKNNLELNKAIEDINHALKKWLTILNSNIYFIFLYSVICFCLNHKQFFFKNNFFFKLYKYSKAIL